MNASFVDAILEVTRDCTVCGLCESVAPEIFVVKPEGSELRTHDPGVWARLRDDILLAGKLCPSGAIRFGE